MEAQPEYKPVYASFAIDGNKVLDRMLAMSGSTMAGRARLGCPECPCPNCVKLREEADNGNR